MKKKTTDQEDFFHVKAQELRLAWKLATWFMVSTTIGAIVLIIQIFFELFDLCGSPFVKRSPSIHTAL